MYWTIFLVSLGFKNGVGSFFEFDDKFDHELLNQNQVYFNRKERFIKFDTKDNELEIELGISVPFIKIPIHTRSSENQPSPEDESKISINGPGLMVAGMLMLTSFIVIPLVFSKTAGSGFNFGKLGRSDTDLWSVLNEVDYVLSDNNINSFTCGQKALCWVAKTSKGGKDGSIGNYINHLLSTWWVDRLIDGTFVKDAVITGQSGNKTCSSEYQHCPISQQHLKLAADTFVSAFRRK